MSGWRALWLIALVACSGDDEAVLERCPLGDSNAPAQIEIVHLDANYNIVDTQPDGDLELVPAPQGGWFILLGVRATNLDGCQMSLTASFKDIGSDAIIKLDQRPAVLDDLGTGWGVSSFNTFGILPVCPQVNSLRDLHGEPYDVTVSVRDIDNKTASKTMRIRPVCQPGILQCECECDRDYVLGGMCPPG